MYLFCGLLSNKFFYRSFMGRTHMERISTGNLYTFAYPDNFLIPDFLRNIQSRYMKYYTIPALLHPEIVGVYPVGSKEPTGSYELKDGIYIAANYKAKASIRTTDLQTALIYALADIKPQKKQQTVNNQITLFS